MAYRDFKDLNRKTAANKVLRDKAFNIAKNPKYDGYECGLVLMVYKLKKKACKMKNLLKNYTNQFLENLKNEKFTHLF